MRFFHKYLENNCIQQNDLVDIVYSNDTYFIEYVIAKGIDIHQVDNMGRTLLFWASVPVIPLLLKYGLDINSTDIYGRSALMISCSVEDFNDACELIRNGCNINVIDDDGDTALEIAFQEDNFKLVEVLLDHSAVIIDNTDNLLKVVYCMHHRCRLLKQQVATQTEQTKDLTMYRDFYELTHFEFCR